jgi:hypothetical protein
MKRLGVRGHRGNNELFLASEGSALGLLLRENQSFREVPRSFSTTDPV